MSNIRLLHWLGLLSLLCVTGSGSALTIGRQQGLAVLGRPLEVQVPVGLDPGMDAAELCPEAEVSYGDTRLPLRLVDVQVLGAGESARIRVRALPPLDEPFAALQVRIGCGQKLARRFVLLAEEPAGDRPASVAAATALPMVTEALRPPGGDAGGPATGTGSGGPAGTPGGAAAAPAAGAGGRTARTPPAAPTSAAANRPRLQLDAVDIRMQGAGSTSAPLPGGPARPGAAADGRQALAATGTPAVDDAARAVALEAEVRKLQDALQSSRAAAAELRARTQQAERERFTNPLVFGLGAVAALALLLAGLAWRRAAVAERPRAHFRSLAERSAAALDAPLWPTTPIEHVAPAATTASSNPVTSAPASPESPLRPDAPADAAPDKARGDGMPRGLASMNARLPEPLPLSTHELNDIQQEADFFVSLGEYERAIEVLRNHIELHPQSSALAWLDLLEIQHKLGRKDEYEQLRQDFEWLFNVKMPSFEAFDAEHDDLEGHPELLARIQAAWPDPAVQKVIDAAIFRTPVDGQGKPLGLQAYRDLLFLHQLAHTSMAKGTEAPVSAASDAEDFVPPLDFPAPGRGSRGALATAASGLAIPLTSQRLARDLDLDFDLEEILAQPAAAPDPTRGEGGKPDPESQSRFAQGLDALLNFDLEPPALTLEQPGETAAHLAPVEAAGQQPARRRAV